MGRASSTAPSPTSFFPASPGRVRAPAAPLCLLSPFKTAEGGLFLTEAAASEAATVTNSRMMSLSVTGGDEAIIAVRGRWEFIRPDALDLGGAASAAVEKGGRSCCGWWWWWWFWPCAARSRLPPLPTPLPSAVLPALAEWTLLLGIRVGPLIAGEEKDEGSSDVEVDKHWNRRPVRLLLTPRPLTPRSCLPPPPPLPPLFRDECILPAGEDSGCTVAVVAAATAAVVVAAVTPPPPRQDASATADRTGVARIVGKAAPEYLGKRRRDTTQRKRQRRRL